MVTATAYAVWVDGAVLKYVAQCWKAPNVPLQLLWPPREIPAPFGPGNYTLVVRETHCCHSFSNQSMASELLWGTTRCSSALLGLWSKPGIRCFTPGPNCTTSTDQIQLGVQRAPTLPNCLLREALGWQLSPLRQKVSVSFGKTLFWDKSLQAVRICLSGGRTGV